MAIKYNEMKHTNGRTLWWRVIGHRGGRTYEVSEPAEAGKGRAVVRRNVRFWVIDDEWKLLRELASKI